MTYLVLSLVALAAFYMWRFTVWAADAGGYWNLVTGRHAPPTGVGEAAMAAVASANAKAKSKVSHGITIQHFRSVPALRLPEPYAYDI